MTKTSSRKNRFVSRQGMLILPLALLFSLQPSAEAFLGSLQTAAASPAQSSIVQPSEEMSSISDKNLLQSALQPLDQKSNGIQAVYPSSGSAVSISTYQNRYRRFARFLFASNPADGIRRYQSYELNPLGRLGRVIETGILMNGQFIRERIYDYEAGTVVLYNHKNIFEKRIYELREYGEPGRPVQYRGRNQSGDLINIRFLYQNHRLTCVHMKNMTFSTYEFSNGVLGRLLEVGTARAISKKGELEPSRRISISEMTRQGEVIPAYIFHEGNGVQVIRERIGGTPYTLGAMGRVLRFISQESDLEYFYQEASFGQAAKVKVLNHLLGESLTFEVTGKDLNENSGRLKAVKDSLRTPLTKAVFSSFPMFFKDSAEIQWAPAESKSLPIYIRLNDEVLIWEKLLRGPPASHRDLFYSLTEAIFFPFPLFFLSVIRSASLSGVQA